MPRSTGTGGSRSPAAAGRAARWVYGRILLGHDAFFAGRCAEAETLARDGQVLADELGYRLSALRLKSLLARVAAARGDAETVAVSGLAGHGSAGVGTVGL